MKRNQATASPRPRVRAMSLIAVLCAFCFAACAEPAPDQTNAKQTSAPAGNANSTAGQTNANQPPAGAQTAGQTNANQPAATGATAPTAHPTAVIETDLGKIKVELFEDQAPATTKNFLDLAKSGYYDGLKFHRVISGFMIQGGDPNGNGTGGKTASGGTLPNEINSSSPLYQGGYARGILAMANKGRPETAGSQFFIMHQKYPLPPNYTIFGRVTEGMEVVDKIAAAPVQGDRPATPVAMKKVTVQ